MSSGTRSSRRMAAADAGAAAEQAPAGPHPHEDGGGQEEEEAFHDVAEQQLVGEQGASDADAGDGEEEGADAQLWGMLVDEFHAGGSDGSDSGSGDEDEDEDSEGDLDDDEEEDEFEAEEAGEAAGALTSSRVMSLLFSHRRLMHSDAQGVLGGLPRLPLPVAPLQGDLAARLNAGARPMDVGQVNPVWDCLDASFDALRLPPLSTDQQRRKRKMQDEALRQAAAAADADISDAPAGGSSGRHSAGGVATRVAARRRAATTTTATAAAAAPGTSTSPTPSSPSSTSTSAPCSGFRLSNAASLLLKRELCMHRSAGGFSSAQRAQLGCTTALPLFPQAVRDRMRSRAYIGQYSASGDFFTAAYQDKRVRVYDTQRGWRLRKDVTTRMTRWTITDTTMSPDQRLLVYASISPVAFVVNVGSSGSWDDHSVVVDSRANVTELHEPLGFDGSTAAGGSEGRRAAAGSNDDDDDDDEYGGWHDRSFGVWSIAWSPQGGQLIAGTSSNAVHVLDLESKQLVLRLTGHGDDVNAVAYLDSASPNIIVSGSDDVMVRVWDTRDRRAGIVKQPQGVLVGHTEGLTHLSPKGDGLHFISNCKDQSIKLWDVRAALAPSAAAAAARLRPRTPRWDYRWEDWPAEGRAVIHPGDVSLMTYRGHSVRQTLIRAYWSPQHSTGQRYIYAGGAEVASDSSSSSSSSAPIYVWDVVSGQLVAQLQHHESLVRDCSWHPYEPELTSVSWDGSVVSWGVEMPAAAARGLRSGADHHAHLDAYYA